MKYDRILGYKPGRRTGEMAKALSGRIHVSVFLVSQISDRWKADTASEVKRNLEEGEDWIAGQAARYGKQVTFINTYFGDENDKPLLVKNFQTYSGIHSLKELLKIQKKRGMDDWNTYVRFVREDMKCEHGIIVFVYIKPDRSYALHSYNDYRFSSTVCHKDDNPGIFAHEILHLFSAWDMYKREFDKGEARQLKCKIYFSKSIMHQAHYWKYQEIDEINAWLVGLKEEEKPWYNLFFPGWEEKEDQIYRLMLYRDWRTGEYSDKPVPPKPAPPKAAAPAPVVRKGVIKYCARKGGFMKYDSRRNDAMKAFAAKGKALWASILDFLHEIYD